MTAALANRITEKRLALGFSQTELADRVGVSKATISRWESGSSFATGNNLDRLATCFDTTVSDLFADPEGIHHPIHAQSLTRTAQDPAAYAQFGGAAIRSVNALHERLREAMAGPPKIKQTALARACGLTVSSVNDWTRGKTRKIEGANLMAAARFLRVSADWLATGSGAMRPSQDSPIDNKEVRKRNLGWLSGRAGGSTAFAELVGRSQVQVSQWVGGTPVGDKLARHVESALGYPRGWLDTPQWPTESATETNSAVTLSKPFQMSALDHAIMTHAKRWVLAEETLAGPYPHDELVDQVVAVYELMQASGGDLTPEQRIERFKATQARNEKAGERTGTGAG